MKQKILFYTLLFGLGFFGYGLIEIIWRGHTHPSMSLAGAISFCLLSVTAEYLKPLRFIYRCIAGGLLITLVELLFGGIMNLWLTADVWDYSMFPLNYFGQICMLYSVLWCFLSAPIIILSELIKDRVCNSDKITNRNVSTETA